MDKGKTGFDIGEKIDFVAVANSCKAFADQVRDFVKEDLECLAEFDKDSARKVSQFGNAKESIQETVAAAYTYVDTVDDFFYYGQRANFENIKNSIRNGDNTKLNEFLSNATNWIQKIYSAYDHFTDKCKEVTRNCDECAESCAYHQAEAKKKNTQQG